MERHAVIGVVGCSGGVGSSTFAAVLAGVAGVAEPCLLVDVDPAGGGIDVLLAIEGVPGVRWSGVRVDGGSLDPHALLRAVPRWGSCGVLAADAARVPPDALGEVIESARSVGWVVLDLPRHDCAERREVSAQCDLVVLVVRSDVVGISAAHAAAASLGGARVGVVARRGQVRSADAARAVGAPLLGELPALRPSAATLDRRRLPRPSVRVAEGVVAGLRREAAA